MSDTTIWYCPVEDIASFRGLVNPDFAKVHEVSVEDPWEKLTELLVVLNPSAITVDISCTSDVVIRFVEIVLPVSVDTVIRLADSWEVISVDPVRVDTVSPVAVPRVLVHSVVPLEDTV